MSPIESQIAAVVKPVPPPDKPGDLPYPTHSGVLNLCGVELIVHRLSTGQTIIERDSMVKFCAALGMTTEDVRALGLEAKL